MTETHGKSTYQTLVWTSADPHPIEPAKSTYRQLVSRGLELDEAANLTAFLSGLAICVQPWTISEVNHLLFLRERYRLGRYGKRAAAS